ncbi:MAG: TlpA family protein disulfide reductase [Candidatus Latescibacteria bacterium]|nr:TlpA family protein disulfide reductase [Candidatus Latescibacterota bacterium]
MQDSMLVAVLCSVVMVASVHAASLDQPAENPPGWSWLIPPMPMPTPQSAWSQRGVMGIASQTPDGAYLLTLAWQRAEGTRYRIVVFDPRGRRYELDEQLGTGSGLLYLAQFRVDPALLPQAQIRAVGVEQLTPEGWRIASQIAAERARAAQIEILPLPRLNEPYRFTLTTVNGRQIRAEDLHGSVVVLDCWATWCGPCMAKMPQLRASYEAWRPHGFEVIGINFDQDWNRAVQALQELNIPWAQVAVPNDRGVRELWYEVSSIRTLPRILVLDREGILRMDTLNPREAEAVIHQLLAPSPKPE